MTITNIKELSRLIDLCRKKGIESVEIDNIKMKLGRIEPKLNKKDNAPELKAMPAMTDEDYLFWSSDGVA